MSRVITSIILHKQRPLQEGGYPVRLRVNYQRKRRYFSLALNAQEMMYATEDEWKKIHSPKARGKYKDIKLKIAYYEDRAEKVVGELEQSKQSFTFERFRTRFFGIKQKNTVFHLFEEIIEQRRKEERIGTAISYGNALNKLKKFTKNKDLFFADVDVLFLKKWEKHLLDEGMSINTVGIYMRSLRVIYNEAIKRKFAKPDEYPFLEYKIPAARKAKRALRKPDILKIWNYEVIPQSKEGKAKNYFMFSYLMQGMNFADIAHLRNENIADGRISYYRLKKISVKVTPEIESLLTQLRSEERDQDAYVFPILQPGMSAERQKAVIKQFIKDTNDALNLIGEKLEMPLKLTTYVARHSYATILKGSGVPTAVISETLGHENEKTTESYLDSFDLEVYDEVNKHLL